LFTYLILWFIQLTKYRRVAMKQNLSTLEIKILFKCDTGLKSKSDITQLFKPYSKEERAKAIKNLIADKLILAQEMPKADSNKTPVFYKITEAGKNWVEDYNKNYPG